MGLNNTPNANRLHIGFFGCINAGKSSLVNAITGQDLAVVSDIKGTTTDPVSKAMELLPLGPVVIIDTAGYDDDSLLGEKRIEKTIKTLNKVDIAVLVIDGENGINDYDKELLDLFEKRDIPYLIAENKADLHAESDIGNKNAIAVSALTGYNINELKERLAHIIPETQEKHIISDLIPEGSIAVLVVPIDESAPKGRIILPQQQTLRDLLDGSCIGIVCKETELEHTLGKLPSPPVVVITDSQAFDYVSKIVPDSVPLTSFSILMARYKGFLKTAINGIKAIDELNNGDTVLIAEGCTHHRQCNDIGTVKIPNWLKKYTNKNINIKTCSGTEFPNDLREYSLIIHCGGCMLNEREVQSRMKQAIAQGIPFTNYGILIAHINGILDRSIEILK